MCFFPLAASEGVPKNSHLGFKPENVHCSSATSPLRIELRWGCEESSRKNSGRVEGFSFKYDPFGRRIYKSSSVGASVYAYDADNLIEETNASGGVVARYMSGGNTSGSTTWLQTKVFFQALGRNFVNEFKPNGCFAQFANEFATGQADSASPPGAAPEDVIRSAGRLRGVVCGHPRARLSTQVFDIPRHTWRDRDCRRGLTLGASRLRGGKGIRSRNAEPRGRHLPMKTDRAAFLWGMVIAVGFVVGLWSWSSGSPTFAYRLS